MFVLKSTYQSQLEANSLLSQEITELREENKSIIAQLKLAADTDKENKEDNSKEFDRLLLNCTLDCIDQIEGIRSTVLSSHQAIDTGSQSTDQINGLLDVSSSSLETIVTEMKGLTTNMGGMTQNISGLSEMADNINSFVATISKISDQTNLLALNAAIEAARAGEAGRGFSVVADEVRSLAKNTNTSANEVSDLVKQIIHSTSETVESVNIIQASNNDLSSGVANLNNDYHSIIDCCTSMKGTITDASLRTFIQTVKLDHIVWKGEVYAVASGNSNKPLEDFTDHHNCRMGKWYDSTGKDKYGHLSAFKNIHIPHQQVHQYGIEALEFLLHGHKTQAIAKLQAMESASLSVMNQLDQLSQ